LPPISQGKAAIAAIAAKFVSSALPWEADFLLEIFFPYKAEAE
jgi:hypothetical protein